jgi:molecular chaperone GrpE (heat shock protein)
MISAPYSQTMDQSLSNLNQFAQVVNKHVLGNQNEFVRLKDKLEMCEHATSKAGAAALGYLMAMEEMEELKSEAGNSVYDKVLEVVDGLISANGQHFAESACDEIFTIIYEWLDKILEGEGYEKSSYLRELIASAFREYIVQE